MPTGKNNILRKKVFRHVFKLHGFFESLNIALKGLLYLFLYHRNMRIIFMLGFAAFLAGLVLNLNGIELIILCVTITLVFMAEIFNTAIEMLMNMITSRYHLRIKIVKDIAAAVVVLACLNAIAVGYVLFVRRIIK
jgi:diacylglycerol kinase (ATP)